ncbi:MULTISPECIES: hypothetical protein [Psychrobacter]|uniref:hypothetical protein n=1 Tax=Psychrobacter TaxID=497 RepID=UPI00146A7F00|nr:MULTISPECIES: hypothetical protein [Psychrobacter]
MTRLTWSIRCSAFEAELELSFSTKIMPQFGQMPLLSFNLTIDRALLQRSGELLQYPII